MTLLEAGAVLVFACVDLGTRFRCRRMQRVHRTQSANLSGAGGSETDEDQGCASDPGAALEAFQVHGVAGPAQEAHVPGCVPAGAAAVQHGRGGGQFPRFSPSFRLVWYKGGDLHTRFFFHVYSLCTHSARLFL